MIYATSFIISGDAHGMVVKFFNEHEGEYTSEDYFGICEGKYFGCGRGNRRGGLKWQDRTGGR